MDQNGSVHEFEYDLLGRQIVDKATTLGTDVDDVVRRVEREYGVHGMLERTANYDATTAGSVVNDVEFTYNGFGQLTVDSQEHDGEVDGNTLDVQYAHVAGASNLYRRALTTYPNGRVLYYYYGGICDYISRPYYVRDFPTANDTCHGVYYYQGLDEIIRHSVNLSGAVTLDREYDNGSGGYSDRFGRLTNLYWYGWVPQACVAQVKHDYDRAGNRLCREDVLAKSQGTPIYIDELYTYDGMHQLTAQQRGELNVAHDALVANSKTFAEQWTLDPTGNWSEFKQDTDGDGDWDLDQDRDHTTANEVLEIDDATTHVAHDRAGNMTRIPKPSDWSSHYHLVYDAWNRLVCVYDSDGETPISAYYYDGLGRRVIKDLYDEGSLASRRHYYYSDTWQVLEERLETSDGSGGFDTAIVDRQYVWGLRYVDDLLSRDRNTDGTSTGDYGKTGSGLDERLMVLQDANYNVCAIANTTGVCLERYNYTSYGEPNCLTPTFADRASTDYDWDILYTGRQYDAETGLYQYRRRYYHPQLGRFINRDPIGYRVGGNLYEYVSDNPLNAYDPKGLIRCPAANSSYDDTKLPENDPNRAEEYYKDGKFSGWKFPNYKGFDELGGYELVCAKSTTTNEEGEEHDDSFFYVIAPDGSAVHRCPWPEPGNPKSEGGVNDWGKPGIKTDANNWFSCSRDFGTGKKVCYQYQRAPNGKTVLRVWLYQCKNIKADDPDCQQCGEPIGYWVSDPDDGAPKTPYGIPLPRRIPPVRKH